MKRIGSIAKSTCRSPCMVDSIITSCDRMRTKSFVTGVDWMVTNRLIAKRWRSLKHSCLTSRNWTRWVRCRTCELCASTANRRVTMQISVRRRSMSSSRGTSSLRLHWTERRDFKLNLSKASRWKTRVARRTTSSMMSLCFKTTKPSPKTIKGTEVTIPKMHKTTITCQKQTWMVALALMVD